MHRLVVLSVRIQPRTIYSILSLVYYNTGLILDIVTVRIPSFISLRIITNCYAVGHTFVPAIIPYGTVLHHGRRDYDPPPSPEYFAFDFDHSYMFCFGNPCVVLTYAVNRDLRVGYFDGTGAAEMYGPRDMQDVMFNNGFIPPNEYNAWVHAKSMCVWARKVGLDGIVR
jgi:hypothetical protein